MKAILLSFGVLGTVLFGALYYFTYDVPESIERAGYEFLQYQIEKEIRDQYGAIEETNFSDKIGFLKGKLKQQVESVEQALKDKLAQKIADIIGAMCRLDCEKRQQLRDIIEQGFKNNISRLNSVSAKLSNIVQGKYFEILDNLKQDVRIFLGANTLLFLTLLVLALLKPKAAAHLYLPGIFLLIATLVSSGIYLFGQNWFFTILYNDYMGYGYLVYVAIIFGFLLDIAFNSGRVTTEIINWILNAVGSAMSSLGPC